MFIGHFAPAFVAAAHPKAPKLGILFVAAQLVDIAFFLFVLGGIEHMRVVPGITETNGMDLYHMPYTHSLLGGLFWAVGFAAIVYVTMRSRVGAFIGGAVVLSHWFVDLLVHRPDLTLAGSPPMLGLGLWNQPLIEMPLELGITGAALGYYFSKTRPVTTSGNLPVWMLGLALLITQLINWLGPQPEVFSIQMPIMALAMYILFAALAHWAGNGRILRKAGEM